MTLLTHWEGEPVEAWRQTLGLGWMEVHDTLASTQDRGRILSEGGLTRWTLILAEEQTEGRGRGGKRWVSPGRGGILFSLVVPSGGAGVDRLLPLRVGMVAAGVVEEEVVGSGKGEVRVGLKWPNDLILLGRKMGGILCEGGGGEGVVVGVGLNLASAPEGPELTEGLGAIGLGQVVECELSRGGILARLVAETRRLLEGAGDRLSAAELEEYGRRDTLRGKMVFSQVGGRGVAEGVTREGALLLRREDGRVLTIQAGSVRPGPFGDESLWRERSV